MAVMDGIGRKHFLLPVIASAVTAGGTYAARKLMDGLGDKVGDQAGQLKESLGDLGGGGSRGQGWGRGRRLPIQRSVDVAVPVSYAYEQWTNFEKLGDFLHRVEEVEQRGEKRVVWHENIWGRRRTWHGEIVEKRRNQLI